MSHNTEVHTNDNDEKIINWKEEAMAIINDVKMHVGEINVARKLPSNESKIHLNLKTIEGKSYCVQVSSVGFRIVSDEYDTIDVDRVAVDDEETYETPYALLDKISPSYVKSFGNQLCKQLLTLQEFRMQLNEEDEARIDNDAEPTNNDI